MHPLTERLVRLNIYTGRMIELLTGERPDKPVVYIGDSSEVERRIYEGKNFAIGGDGRRTAVAYILDSMDEVYNVCLTKNDPRYPNIWNLVYESTKEDRSRRKIIFMDAKKPDVILKPGFNASVYKRAKGYPPVPKTGIETKAWDVRMMEFIRDMRPDAPGDVISYVFRKYGKNSRTARALYNYSIMSRTPYGQPYLSRIFKR